jgi:hypothetical protein
LLQVLEGAYDGVTLKSANQAVIADSESGKKGYTIPLEVMPAGQFEPLYRSPLSIQVTHSTSTSETDLSSCSLYHDSFHLLHLFQDGELPVLPMSVYGSVAMAHSEDSEEYSSPTQFFFYLYDKRNVSKMLHL